MGIFKNLIVCIVFSAIINYNIWDVYADGNFEYSKDKGDDKTDEIILNITPTVRQATGSHLQRTVPITGLNSSIELKLNLSSIPALPLAKLVIKPEEITKKWTSGPTTSATHQIVSDQNNKASVVVVAEQNSLGRSNIRKGINLTISSSTPKPNSLNAGRKDTVINGGLSTKVVIESDRKTEVGVKSKVDALLSINKTTDYIGLRQPAPTVAAASNIELKTLTDNKHVNLTSRLIKSNSQAPAESKPLISSGIGTVNLNKTSKGLIGIKANLTGSESLKKVAVGDGLHNVVSSLNVKNETVKSTLEHQTTTEQKPEIKVELGGALNNIGISDTKNSPNKLISITYHQKPHRRPQFRRPSHGRKMHQKPSNRRQSRRRGPKYYRQLKFQHRRRPIHGSKLNFRIVKLNNAKKHQAQPKEISSKIKKNKILHF